VSDAQSILGGEIVWRPTPAQIDHSRVKAFMDRHGVATYDQLLRRSVEDRQWFWPAVLDEIGVVFHEPYSQIVDLSRGPAWPHWCVGGGLNIVHSCLDKWQTTDTATRDAIRWEGEEGTVRVLSYSELFELTNRCANGLRSAGFRKGDRAAIFMPMCPELAAVFFAIVRLGGIVLPLFSGYGVDAVASRLQDSGARVLFTADGFWRRGQRVAMHATAAAAVLASPSVERVVVFARLGEDSALGPKEVSWTEFIAEQPTTCHMEATRADDPLMLLYTSGTTGRPKGAVHSHCGFPIKAAQDMMHAHDVHAGDTMYWVSDIGWMMGPWELFGMTLLGGTALLYDGALDYPGPDRLWALVERHQVNILGVSPTLIRSLLRHGDAPVRQHDLSSLRILGSTGEPWNPEPWRWFFDVVGGGKLPIINYSGGTEVSGGLLAGCVMTPLKPAAFSGPPPGIAADVVDDQGRPVRGEVGELVVRAPWMGMTHGFWNDTQRYEDTYWSRFPGMWVHGDWAAIDEDGLWYVLGRSDDTIKIAGKRLGPAEVESILVEHPAVLEAAAVGIPDELKGQALACVCVLRPGFSTSPALVEELRGLVVERLGKPLRPSVVLVVPDLPKTRNAKVMRRVIRAAYLGENLGDLSALENPRAVDAIVEIRNALRG
jgi:acetyl-CoA synthetase